MTFSKVLKSGLVIFSCLMLVSSFAGINVVPVKAYEFTVKAVREPEEIQVLLEVGFEYVCQKYSLLFFRKRK